MEMVVVVMTSAELRSVQTWEIALVFCSSTQKVIGLHQTGGRHIYRLPAASSRER
jgi:hypothetical protein